MEMPNDFILKCEIEPSRKGCIRFSAFSPFSLLRGSAVHLKRQSLAYYCFVHIVLQLPSCSYRSTFSFSELFTAMSSSPSYKLYGTNASIFTRLVLFVFEELGLSYELIQVDFSVRAHKDSKYMQEVHPFGQVPVLLDGDFKLFESRAIARYLVSKHASTQASESLYPSDLKSRAIVEQWMSVNQSNLGPVFEALMEFLFGPVFMGRTPDESKIPSLKDRINTILSVLDNQLAKTTFLASGHFSLADLVFVPTFQYLVRLKGFEHIFDDHTHVKTWWDAISSRQSWKKVDSLANLLK